MYHIYVLIIFLLFVFFPDVFVTTMGNIPETQTMANYQEFNLIYFICVYMVTL